ncbi:MAG: 2-amino-4-hydroxy-6-hydroxymethyldihydropteridine diphosphokinase [Magnetococcales bacterium]|nr:2-amino-4-hydroxy-6-hydroxymethyldihydropteridine diphosphokinase [Magnetococcales bacterium]
MDHLDYHPILIAFGANVDPLANIRRGLSLLHDQFPLADIATVYRSAPVGLLDQPDFLNGAVRLQPTKSGITPQLLRTSLRQIEWQCGRRRTPDIPRDGPRQLDLDIAIMGKQVVHQAQWRIPDPEIDQRAFLALPLAEIAPDWRHPLLGITMREIATRFDRSSCSITMDAEATTTLRSILSSAPY